MDHQPPKARLGARRALGVEVSPTRIRAFRRGARGAPEAVEAVWGLDAPEESVAVLRECFGSGNLLRIALDMSGVFVKRLELPPLSAAERRRIVETDPGRYFPVRAEALVVGVRDDDLVVATPADAYEAVVRALSSLGVVEGVEPAQVALARHLAAAGHPEAVIALVDASTSSASVARVSAGRIETLRRSGAAPDSIAAVVSEVPRSGAGFFLHPWSGSAAERLQPLAGGGEILPVPGSPGVPEGFEVASGAALGREGDAELALLSPSLGRRLRRGRRQRAVSAAFGLAASLLVLGWTLDARRERTAQALVERVAAAQVEAEPLLAQQARLDRLDADRLFLADRLEGRPDPLAVLSAIAETLPRDAYLVQLSSSGTEWELQGLARDAARLLPLLEENDLFEDVRFRTATTRVQVGGEPLERFTLVLRHVPAT